MHTILNTALIGLFALSGTGVANSASIDPNISAQPAAYTVSLTGYNAVPDQTKPDPSTTASGAYSNPDVEAARSDDLADELPFGTVIEVVPDSASSTAPCGLSLVQDTIGYRVITDAMNAHMHNKVDIMFHIDSSVKVGGKLVNDATALGICRNVMVKVVGHIALKDIPNTQSELAAMVESPTFASAN